MATSGPALDVSSDPVCSSSKEIVPVLEPNVPANLDQVTDIIARVRNGVNNLTWNKHQCSSLADRLGDIGERFEGVDWNTSDGRDSNRGPIFEELLSIVRKVADLVSDYVNSVGRITSNVLSRTDNREAFSGIHAELNRVEAKWGILGPEGVDSTPGPLELAMLAKTDREEMLDASKQMQRTSGTVQLAKILEEKLVNHHIEDVSKSVALGKSSEDSLPSYLKIDLKSELYVKGKLVHDYVRYSEHDPLAEVGWAFVHSGRWLDCDFAIKVFDCGAEDWNKKQLLMEVSSLLELQHPHIVRMVGFGQAETECAFVMELMDDNLRKFMKARMAAEPNRKKPFTDREEVDVISQIAKGMCFMHKKGWVHGDLKCSNILVKQFGNHNLEVKISDFRGSQKLDRIAGDFKALEHALKTKRPRWTAPEAIDCYGWDQSHEGTWVPPPGELLKQGDVYSFGMTCYEIVTGKYPFNEMDKENCNNFLEIIQAGEPEKLNLFPREVNQGLKALITSCWNKDPSKRPVFDSIYTFLDNIRSGIIAERTSTIPRFSTLVRTAWSQIGKHIPSVKRGSTGERISIKSGDAKDSGAHRVHLLRSPSLIEASSSLNMIPHHELERGDAIGLGTWGFVFKATWLGCTFAVKILRDFARTQELEREVKFLETVSRHPCIVQMVGISKNLQNEYSIVMEYMDGDLRKLIDTRKKAHKGGQPFSLCEAQQIISKIAWGMAYLHSRGLVHRDLNSANVLAQDYTETVDVKIVDFGKSHLEVSTSERSEMSKSLEFDYFSDVGSGFYRAPEMLRIAEEEELPADMEKLRGSKADLNALKAADVFSFAILCQEVLTGDFPEPESPLPEPEHGKEVRRGFRPEWRHNDLCTLKLKSLIEQCWSLNPAHRPAFVDICIRLRNDFHQTPS